MDLADTYNKWLNSAASSGYSENLPSMFKISTDILECTYCTKIFNGRNKKQNLKHHMMIHTGERRYTCPFCGTRHTHKWHLKNHVTRCHSEHVQDESLSWLGLGPNFHKSSTDIIPNNDACVAKLREN